MNQTYAEFLDRKSQCAFNHGFEPTFMPDALFDFQKYAVLWATRKGRAALYEDCGLGKTLQQLVWAENVVRHTNLPVLILTPLAVGSQTVAEAHKFGIHAVRSAGGSHAAADNVVVTNYEKLHLFNADDFGGVVCDESSILKHYTGATQQAVTQFMKRCKYRLLCTATAAPNDYTELGTSSEALGEVGMVDMLTRFFTRKAATRAQAGDNRNGTKGAVVAGTGAEWRMKGHAVEPFWKWVCSWALACRKPSDLGFGDGDFILPELNEVQHCIKPERPADGMLFTVAAYGLKEEREERARTAKERTETAAQLAIHTDPVVVWCSFNYEADAVEKLIPGARQIHGHGMSDEEKEELYTAFSTGQLRALVTKSKLSAWGLNWQHCAHSISFASHSYEQYYQQIRRFHRFGQKRAVRSDIIYTTGEQYVAENMQRKGKQADEMFQRLIGFMNQANHIERRAYAQEIVIPDWLSENATKQNP